VANEIRGKLTTKQARFVKYYVALDENATQAAIKAGYSVNTARRIGSENLTKRYIADAIEEYKKVRTPEKSHKIATPEEILESHTREIRVDPGCLFDESGKTKPIHEIPEDVRLALSDVYTVQDNNGNWVFRYRLLSKSKACESMSKILGLTNGNHDLIEELLKNLGITVNIQNNVQINQADGSGLLKAIEAAKCGE
jgi:phage terminase small subunit